jgi:hypothetical protein
LFRICSYKCKTGSIVEDGEFAVLRWHNTMFVVRTKGHQALETTRTYNLVKAPEDTRVKPERLTERECFGCGSCGEA